jgi:hypothetical protein
VETESKLRSGLRWIGHDGRLLILLAALIACAPRFTRGISCGHDFGFHLVSWLEVQRAWSQGILYPHWAQSPNWGSGEPRFVFYPPISWMAGALLGYVVPWQWVAAVFTWICLAATGLTTRSLTRQFLPPPSATLAGVIATTTPYILFTAYERTAFSELAAGALMPLLILLALRPIQPRRIPDFCWLSLVLAAIWLTNAPAGVMASYLLAFAALTAALLRRSWEPAVRALIAAPLGLGLAAFYWIPAAWEQRWIAIDQAVDVGMRISDSWLFARHPSPDLELHDQVLRVASTIVLLTVAAATAGFLIALRRHKLPTTTRTFWIPLALLVPILLFLQFPLSAPLWNLPKLQFLQFPWRWLTVLDIPFAIFLAAATPLSTRRGRIRSALVWTTILGICAAVASLNFYQRCDEDDAVDNQVAVFHAGTGVDGTDEYAPAGADNTLVASSLPEACLVSDPLTTLGEGDPGSEPAWYPEQGSCDEIFAAQTWQPEHKQLQIDSDHIGFLILRLRRYPAWQITINSRSVPASPSREDGLMVLPINAGPSTIDIRWQTTPDARWGQTVSLISLAAFFLALGLWIIYQRRMTIHLSSKECLSTSSPT